MVVHFLSRCIDSGSIVGNWEVGKILLSSSGLPVIRPEHRYFNEHFAFSG
jgi:hypothetical protein